MRGGRRGGVLRSSGENGGMREAAEVMGTERGRELCWSCNGLKSWSESSVINMHPLCYTVMLGETTR